MTGRSTVSISLLVRVAGVVLVLALAANAFSIGLPDGFDESQLSTKGLGDCLASCSRYDKKGSKLQAERFSKCSNGCICSTYCKLFDAMGEWDFDSCYPTCHMARPYETDGAFWADQAGSK